MRRELQGSSGLLLLEEAQVGAVDSLGQEEVEAEVHLQELVLVLVLVQVVVSLQVGANSAAE